MVMFMARKDFSSPSNIYQNKVINYWTELFIAMFLSICIFMIIRQQLHPSISAYACPIRVRSPQISKITLKYPYNPRWIPYTLLIASWIIYIVFSRWCFTHTGGLFVDGGIDAVRHRSHQCSFTDSGQYGAKWATANRLSVSITRKFEKVSLPRIYYTQYIHERAYIVNILLNDCELAEV